MQWLPPVLSALRRQSQPLHLQNPSSPLDVSKSFRDENAALLRYKPNRKGCPTSSIGLKPRGDVSKVVGLFAFGDESLSSELSGPPRRFLLFRRYGYGSSHLYPRLLIHPRIQKALLEPPAVSQLERRNKALRRIAVQRVSTDAQILRRLPDIHHLASRNLRQSSHQRTLQNTRNKPDKTPHNPGTPFVPLSIDRHNLN